jgi:hypothetical protein
MPPWRRHAVASARRAILKEYNGHKRNASGIARHGQHAPIASLQGTKGRGNPDRRRDCFAIQAMTFNRRLFESTKNGLVIDMTAKRLQDTFQASSTKALQAGYPLRYR